MKWKNLTNLIGASGNQAEGPKRLEIQSVFHDFDSRVQASLGFGLPPSLAEGIDRLIGAVPISKKTIVATGVLRILAMCESLPEKVGLILKTRAFQTKGRVALCISVPLESQERLVKFVSIVDNISQRDVAGCRRRSGACKMRGLEWRPLPGTAKHPWFKISNEKRRNLATTPNISLEYAFAHLV